jgi:hypothetical protein
VAGKFLGLFGHRDRPGSTAGPESKALQRAERSLVQAKASHKEQVRKRDQEQEAVIARLERLAGEDSNHLGELVLQALTERYGKGKGAG